jgi:hypothetical protein
VGGLAKSKPHELILIYISLTVPGRQKKKRKRKIRERIDRLKVTLLYFISFFLLRSMRMIRTTNVIQSTGNFWVELICREHVVPPHLIRNQKDVASVLSLLLLGKLVSGATRSTVGSRSPPGSSSSTGRPRRIFSPHSFTFIHC